MHNTSVTFNDLDNSPALEEYIIDKSTKLDQYFNQIKACDVVVSQPHRHHNNKFFHIQIKLSVPGKNLLVNREPEIKEQHTDPQLAVRDAFKVLQRQLQDYASQKNAH